MASGLISERQGLVLAFKYLKISFENALDLVLENVSIDPYFRPFVDWCWKEGYELSVLSGGFKELIEPLLAREGLGDVRVIANSAKVEAGCWKVVAASSAFRRLCEDCNHCKTFSLYQELRKSSETMVVYIGDGHTDTCPVQLAHLVYAKGFLQNYCEQNHLFYRPFSHFGEIQSSLRENLRRYIQIPA